MKRSNYGSVQTLTLTDGKKVKVRRPSLFHLIASGGFPANIASEMLKLTESDLPAIVASSSKVDADLITRLASVIEKYVPFVLVDPIVGEATDLSEDADSFLHGVVSIQDLYDRDKQTLFLFGQGVFMSNEELASAKEVKEKEELASGLARFRGGEGSTNAGYGGEEIRSEAIVADRPEGV